MGERIDVRLNELTRVFALDEGFNDSKVFQGVVNAIAHGLMELTGKQESPIGLAPFSVRAIECRRYDGNYCN